MPASHHTDPPHWSEYRNTVVNDKESLTIPIRLPNGASIGHLSAVTRNTLANDAVIDAFTRWRKTYGRFFLTQFTPSSERTRNWLETIIADERRMLFTIHSGNALVGHYGFRDLCADSAELDNLMRGERGGHARLMQRTVLSMARWLFSYVGLRTVFGNILADNAVAIKLHTDSGFILGDLRPLTLITDGIAPRWAIGPAGGNSPQNKFYQEVVLHTRHDLCD